MAAQYFSLYQPRIAVGRAVKLDDGRIGLIDTIAPSPMVGPDGKPEQIDRAYVIGVRKEFADWVVLNQIVHVYGVAENATGAAFSA